ncbi:MAG: efflux RND transporter periplasmic adaptor subunit [Actinobacteria bacterium]|nr:efflux RND transporter periplasmic adaptor subunit [Actinomycetota bacterium]
MRLKQIPWIFILLVFACNKSQESLDTQIAVPVSVQDVSLQPIEEFVTTTGTVKAIQQVVLKAETDGFYRLGKDSRGKPYVLGDYVERGDIIIYLDNPELENNIKIESQKLNLDISRREFEKQKSLYDKGGVTLRELKDAERAFIDAKYNYDNAIIQLAKMKIVAPFSGFIVDLPYYTEGTRVSLNAPMVQIMNYKKLYTEINLPGKELGRIKVEQPVRILNYTLPKDTLWGKISQVSPAIDADTRSFKAFVEVDNQALLLRPGMFVKAEVVVAKKDSAIVIPKDIILAGGHGKHVFVVVKGAAEERRITTGLENPDDVEVTDGLKVDERLIVKGFETLRNRTKVKVVR